MRDNMIQKTIYDSEKLIEWGGALNEFLWVCAGADRKILRQCPTDYAKYAGIGGTILFTSLMAMLSGGYALYSIFHNVYAASGFGLFWGLLIFNLDRFIVNTMYSDGKVTISRKEFAAGLPRIIMAIFLGIVISTPLELKIFEDEINVTIDEMKSERITAYTAIDQSRLDSLSRRRAELVSSPVDPLFQGTLASTSSEAMTLSNQISSLNSEKNETRSQLNIIQGDINHLIAQKNTYSANSSEFQKLQGKITSLANKREALVSKISKMNTQVTELSSQLRKTSASYDEALKGAESQRKSDITLITNEIDELSKKIRNANSTYNDVISRNFNGLQARMSAFSKMKDENTSTQLSSLVIMLLFIIIETAPTFFKMMIASGPYDDLLRAEMHRVRVLSEKRISDINDEVNTEVQITVEKNKERLEAELKANKAVMDLLTTAQAEIIQQAISEWRNKEMTKVLENPSAYIQGSSEAEHPPYSV